MAKRFARAERFEGRPDDLYWGPYDYSVTRSQRNACEAVAFLLDSESPGFFCSQVRNDGTIIMGKGHRSVDIRRDGRVVTNRSKNA